MTGEVITKVIGLALDQILATYSDFCLECQRRCKFSPLGRSKSSPLNVLRNTVVAGCPGSP